MNKNKNEKTIKNKRFIIKKDENKTYYATNKMKNNSENIENTVKFTRKYDEEIKMQKATSIIINR